MKIKSILFACCFCFIATCGSKAQTISNTVLQVMGWYNGTNDYPSAQGTNFVFNLNQTNGRGYFIYHSIVATNDVMFVDFTNAVRWHLVSYNVLASGGTRRIGVRTNMLPHMNLTGFTTNANLYTLNLLSGNEFRITLETNGATMSTVWATFGQ